MRYILAVLLLWWSAGATSISAHGGALHRFESYTPRGAYAVPTYQTVPIQQADPQEVAAIIATGGVIAMGLIGVLIYVVRKKK